MLIFRHNLIFEIIVIFQNIFQFYSAGVIFSQLGGVITRSGLSLSGLSRSRLLSYIQSVESSCLLQLSCSTRCGLIIPRFRCCSFLLFNLLSFDDLKASRHVIKFPGLNFGFALIKAIPLDYRLEGGLPLPAFFGFIEFQLTTSSRVLLTIIFGDELRDHFGDFLTDFPGVDPALLPGDSLGDGGDRGVTVRLSLPDLAAVSTQPDWDPLAGGPRLPGADRLLVDLALRPLLLPLAGSEARVVHSETLNTSPRRSSLQSLTDDCGQGLEVTGEGGVSLSSACMKGTNQLK